MQKTNSIERKTGAARLQTARSEQNYRHVTELICSREGNAGFSRSPRKMINLTAIELCLLREAVMDTNTSSLMYFAIVKMILGCFNYIVTFLYKMLTHLSGFGFILCRKNDDWNAILFIQLNMYTCSANSIIWGVSFYGPLCIEIFNSIFFVWYW